MKSEDYEIGKHYIFWSKDVMKYLVSRLDDIKYMRKSKEGVSISDLPQEGFNIVFKPIYGGYFDSIAEIPDHILKEINFIATSEILK